MYIYLFLLVLTGLSALFVKDKKIRIFVILVVFIISAFRAEKVGLDTINYVRGGLSEWSVGIKNMQFIYAWLTSIKSNRSHLLVFVFSFCILCGIIISSRRFKVDPLKAIFFFIIFSFYSLSLNIARQYAAIGLILVAYSFLMEKGKKKYMFFIFVILAYGFHSSSVIALVALPISYINFSKINKIYTVTLVIGCFVLLRYVLKDTYLMWTQTLLLPDELKGYSLYFEQATNADLSIGGDIIIFLTLCVNIYVFLVLSEDSTDNGKLIASLFFTSLIFDIFFSTLYGNIGRLRYSINIINIIAFAKYFQHITDNKKRVMLVLTLVVFGYDFIYLLTGHNHAYGTVPYSLMF